MSSIPGAFDADAIETAISRGPEQLTGTFRLDLTTGAWWWSDETFRMHGFEPGEVVPTTALVLAHKHPDDQARVRRILDDSMRTGQPFSSVHRILDARSRERTLVIVGEGRRDPETQDVVELAGHFIDVTESVAQTARALAAADIAAAAETRGRIEQAKGILGVVCGVDPDEAFAVLTRVSNDRNIPIRELARDVVAAGTSGGREGRERLHALLARRSRSGSRTRRTRRSA